MPKVIEQKLEKQANKKGLKGKKKNAYVYGTMNKMGFMKGNKRTKKKVSNFSLEYNSKKKKNG